MNKRAVVPAPAEPARRFECSKAMASRRTPANLASAGGAGYDARRAGLRPVELNSVEVHFG